ncbi:MAG TPA: hypoxanthine phosphoribosyltransferase [Lentisphaeria bacterium]|nr:MAG: hypoxanthine phosphoribosyltransferase [Lentisphaerae bacterium GWF2_38_69]HBM15000.1 hypoxanthine phosphoribosyltransferase [Lentisphaeria bacterium]
MDNFEIETPRQLVGKEKIAERIEELGKQITSDYKGRDLTIVCIMKGCIPFVADLMRHIDIPFKIDTIQATSYHGGTETSGTVIILQDSTIDIKDQYVILVDDILDTGKTMMKIIEQFRGKKPKDIKICVLLDKPSRRTEAVQADYYGFQIPNKFVVGYGLDYNEYYRNLPYIGVLGSD